MESAADAWSGWKLWVHLLYPLVRTRNALFWSRLCSIPMAVLCLSRAVSLCTVSFQLGLNWKLKSGAAFGAASADGFSVDRSRLELLGSKILGSAYAMDVRLLAQLSLSLSATAPVTWLERKMLSLIQFLLDFLLIVQEAQKKIYLNAKKIFWHLYIWC